MNRELKYLGNVDKASSKPLLTNTSTTQQGGEGEDRIQGGSSLPKTILFFTQEAIFLHNLSHPLADLAGEKLQ